MTEPTTNPQSTTPAVQQETVNTLVASRTVGKGVTKFVADLKAALKSGSTLIEAVTIAQAALVDIVPILTQLPSVGGEAVADPADEITTVFLTGRDLYAAITA